MRTLSFKSSMHRHLSRDCLFTVVICDLEDEASSSSREMIYNRGYLRIKLWVTMGDTVQSRKNSRIQFTEKGLPMLFSGIQVCNVLYLLYLHINIFLAYLLMIYTIVCRVQGKSLKKIHNP
jgi:hypothetical protein